MIRSVALLASLTAMTACTADGPEVARFNEPTLATTRDDLPEGADPDACYGRDTTPAVIETVTERVLVQPADIAEDGTIREPAKFRVETRQEIVEDREDIWFQTPCPDEMTPEFVASLQRALALRGYYDGPITGEANRDTREAVRLFQMEQGLNSGVLSIAAAKRLGLVAYDRDETVPEQG